MNDRDRKWRRYVEHPDVSPTAFPAPLNGLVDPPSKLAPTASLIEWRDEAAQCAKAMPDNLNWPVFVAQVEIALAWRETVPLEDRFWRRGPE